LQILDRVRFLQLFGASRKLLPQAVPKLLELLPQAVRLRVLLLAVLLLAVLLLAVLLLAVLLQVLPQEASFQV
jgi:hypothetical protein